MLGGSQTAACAESGKALRAIAGRGTAPCQELQGGRVARTWIGRLALVVGALAGQVLAAGCASPGQGAPPGDLPALTVFAAASLTEAFSEIGRAFEAEQPGVRVTLNFGGSQVLRAQLEHGALADVFAAADAQEMQAIVDAGLAAADAPRVFAGNRMVVITPADNPAQVLGLEDLARPGLRLVLAAETVPAGRYARQVLNRLGGDLDPAFAARSLANLVSDESNVRQVVTKVQLGEADAGLVYATDAGARRGDGHLMVLDIPEPYQVPIAHTITVLAGTRQPELAAAFAAYVLSPAGQSILAGWGFQPPDS